MIARFLRPLAAAALLALAAGPLAAETNAPAPAYEEKSILSPDGTLYVIRSGSATDLGVVGGNLGPSDKLIEWTSRSQDGQIQAGIIPGTVNADVKHNLDIAYDEPSDSLVLLWNEELTVLNVLRLGVYRNGTWSVGNLLPNLGMAHAYNPQMLLSHLSVNMVDPSGNAITKTRTLLSVIWWEEAQYAQARYAPIFLDDDQDPGDVQVYDLPALIGSGGSTPTAGRSTGAYMFPALQVDGMSGSLLASFADLSAGRHYVIRVSFPTELGRPGPDNATWMRRRIPVVGVASDNPIGDVGPIVIGDVKTLIGFAYRPTLAWNTGTAIGYTRFDGKAWSSVRTIQLSDTMTADRAMRLVQEMATRN
ncbi:MAG TPA: hypothetical protein VKG01_20390 [Thermoanaerobaculia bacterium]|nr:hypothetical protein [Thermoanaerobaculia bacterium]